MGRPVLLTVDDDPAVSRAVARDLRRKYGETHRVVRAGSGAEALEALRGLKLRGDPVAVLLADHRMPEMNGVQFLEQAVALFPTAKRLLLTAYPEEIPLDRAHRLGVKIVYVKTAYRFDELLACVNALVADATARCDRATAAGGP